MGTAEFTALLANVATHNIRLQNTLVVPDLRFSLLSWRCMAEAGASKKGDASRTTILVNREVVLEAVPHTGLEIIRMPTTIGTVSIKQLHRKLAHLPPSAFTSLRAHSNSLPPVPTVKGTFDCDASSKAKFTRTIPKTRTTNAPTSYHTIHRDICGPFSVPTPSGSRYFILAIDEYSHRAEVCFLKTQDEVPKALLDMITLAERQYDVSIKIVQTYNAGELTSHWFENGTAKLGIKHKLSIAYIHETNGTAERFNHRVTGSARALLFDSGLPLTRWGEAQTQAIYTWNRMPHASLNAQSPYEVLTGEMPDLGHLQSFGSPAHVFIPQVKRGTAGKLLARTVEGFLVGYGEHRNHYRFWIPSHSRVVISRDFKARIVTSAPEVITIDNSSPDSIPASSSTKPAQIPLASQTDSSSHPFSIAEIHAQYPDLFNSTSPESSSLESAPPRAIFTPIPATFPASAPALPTVQEATRGRLSLDIPPEALTTDLPQSPTEETGSTQAVLLPEFRTGTGRKIRPPSRFGEWGEIAVFGLGNVNEPSVSQVLRSSEDAEWRRAMEQEIVSPEKYNTWEEVTPPQDGRFVDTKWVLRKKRDEHGKLVKFKARLTSAE